MNKQEMNIAKDNNKEKDERETKKTLFTFAKDSCGCGGNCNGSCK